jgi:hypothetical protein
VRLAKLIRFVFLMREGIPSSMKVKSVRYTPVFVRLVPIVCQRRHTKKGDRRRVRPVQGVPVFRKVPSAAHELSHVFKNTHRPCVDCSPGPVETVNRCGIQGRDDGCECCEVVQEAAFLNHVSDSIGQME